MEVEQPQGDSDAGVLERLTNYFEQGEAPPAEEAAESSQEQTEQVDDSEQPEEVKAEEEDPGLVELETEDGETYKVPQKLKDGYLRQSDYTKKTQELASLQKQATAALQQQAVQAQFQEATKEDNQKLLQLQAELQRYKQIDWTNLDTETYIKTRGYIDQLKEQAADIEKDLGRKAQDFQKHLNQRRQEVAKNAYEYIGRYVKDWTPDSSTEREVAAFASNYGIPQEALAEVAVMFPGFAVLAHKAQQYDKLQANKSSVVKTAQKAPPVIKPGATTSTGSANAQKDKQIRQQFKKSGDTKDFARLLLQRGMVK